MSKYLIVNADDFGLSEGVNRGIIEAAEHGILTSASLMVRQPAARAAAGYARTGASLSCGLHLDLGEWVFRHQEWQPLYLVVNTDDVAAVAAEVERQINAFQDLVGRTPTHLDSHQHVHRNEPVRSIMLDWARRLSVPLRECTPAIRYCGDFYGQDGEGEPLPEVLSVPGLQQVLASLTEGITELGCHPGYGDGLNTIYRDERAAEVKALCAPEARAALESLHLELCSFATIASHLPAPPQPVAGDLRSL